MRTARVLISALLALVAVTSGTSISHADDGNLSFPSGAHLGPIVPVYQVGDLFLDSGRPSASQLAAPFSWSAPVLADGVVVGTLTVGHNSEGTLVCMAGDDWWNGDMMQQLPTGGRYVNDGRNGVFVLVGDTVRQATREAYGTTTRTLTDADIYQTSASTLRDAIKAQRAEDARARHRCRNRRQAYADDDLISDDRTL
ncbi:MAG: hypothetical protein FWD75_05585 [Propionibacteriaceae bacterium]|nr:hypothetical protein [Propionibacteriaceae bacterium]